MAKRVACEKCGNMVAGTSHLCPYCRKDPNKWKRRFAFLGLGLLSLYVLDDIYLNGQTARAFFALFH